MHNRISSLGLFLLASSAGLAGCSEPSDLEASSSQAGPGPGGGSGAGGSEGEGGREGGEGGQASPGDWCLPAACGECAATQIATRLFAPDACGRRPALSSEAVLVDGSCCYDGEAPTCDLGQRAAVTVSGENLEAAVESARPGDVIVVEDGTYSGNWRLRGEGTEQAPILIRPETPGGVVLTDASSEPSSLEIVGSRWLIVEGFHLRDVNEAQNALVMRSSDHCIVRDTLFENTGAEASTIRRQKSFVRISRTSRHNVLERDAFVGITDWGVQVWGYEEKDGPDLDNTDNVIRGCHFYRARIQNGNSELLQIGQGAGSDKAYYRSIVEGNLFEDSRDTAELISNKTSGNIYRHNTFRDVDDRVTVRGGKDCIIDGNWFLQSSGLRIHSRGHVVTNNYFGGYHGAASDEGGIVLRAGNRLEGETATGSHDAAEDVLVAHNTFIDVTSSTSSALQVGGNFNQNFDVAPVNLTIVGNLVVVDQGMAVEHEASDGLDVRDNVVWTVGGADHGFEHDGISRIDPGLADQGDHQVPTSDSLLRQGEEVSLDIHGLRRSPSHLIGADQGLCAEGPLGPLTAADVGPSWWQGQ